jgi:hypothetical protein
MRSNRRKPKTSTNKQRVFPYGDGGESYIQDEVPITTATIVQATATTITSNDTLMEHMLSRNLSVPMNSAYDHRSTLLNEPDPEDTLPPPINPWPETLRFKIASKLQRKPNVKRGGEMLSKYRWPDGLKEAVFKSCHRIPLRFYIVDDSGTYPSYLLH